MKKMLLVALFLICQAVWAAAPMSNIVFFGDSLSDNGNLYKLFAKILPKSPPYFQGRFSNGPTWAEHVGEYYYSKYYVDYANYAYGGATALFHPPSTKFAAPTILSLEVLEYLGENLFKDKSKTLFSIWIGGNDYLFDQTEDTEVLTTRVVASISKAMDMLIQHGAKNFLIMNLPDLSKLPLAHEKGFDIKLHALIVAHNQKLANAIQQIQVTHPNIKIIFVDAYELFNTALSNPEKFNEKYNVHIKDVVNACWQGGFIFDHPIFDEKNINKTILNSPELLYAYTLGLTYKQGMVPCENANEHIFWDKMHPTAAVHQVIATIIEEKIAEQLG